MKTRFWLIGLCWVVAVSVAWVCYKQSRTLDLMRKHVGVLEKDALHREQGGASKDGGTMVVISEPAPTSVERVELMRLRSRVTELRERLRERDKLSNQLGQARAQLESVERYTNGKVPAGFRRRQDARMVGGATPEGAVETFFWAIEHQDTNALLQAVDPKSREQIQSQMGNRGSAEFFQEGKALSGFLIVGRTNLAPDLMELQIEVGAGMPTPMPMKLHWIDGAWRLSL
ncbi:MAG: hypothetical protein IT581_12795 [Verrucomicrobiales bacterium]|nr:hypothetical protein [Verrucomicrobiales bacterium]